MKNKNVLLIFIIVMLDQLLKLVITNFLNLYESISVCENFLTFTLVYNDGAAFSILSGNTYLLIIISIFVLLLLFVKSKEYFSVLYSFIIGGIIGNLIDRIFRGYVVDYISFNIFGRDMPIFNLADIFITIPIILLIVISIKEDLCKK